MRAMLVWLVIMCMSGIANANSEKDINAEIHALVNQHRAKKHLEPLEWNDDIADAAKQHSKDMAKQRIPLGHDGFDERMGKLMKGITHCDAAAENVAYGAETAEEVVDMWLQSPGHKKNIEGHYNLTGISTERGKDGKLYFTQIFIHKK